MKSFVSQIQKAEITIISLLFILLSLFSFGCITLNVTPFPTRQIVSQTLPFQEKWRTKAGSIGDNAWKWTQRGLVYANQQRQLVLLDEKHGQILWRIQYNQSNPTLAPLVADEDSVYLTVLSRIYSYNLRNGQQNWETESKGTHRGHFLSFGKRGLYEYEYPARDGNVIRQFDPQTGEILTVDMLPLQNPPILALLDDFYLGETDAGLWAIERETNKVLWHVSGLGIDLSKPVILINDSLIITNNGYLLVLSVDTGEIIWQQPNIASNAVVLESFVYVMMTDANIRAYDLVDGHEVGIIQIEPHMTYLTEGGGNHALEVNPQDRMIYVYYADSQEIIALGQ